MAGIQIVHCIGVQRERIAEQQPTRQHMAQHQQHGVDLVLQLFDGLLFAGLFAQHLFGLPLLLEPLLKLLFGYPALLLEFGQKLRNLFLLRQQSFLFSALEEHLYSHCPWEAELTVTRDHISEPHRIDASGPAFDAFRRACADTWNCMPKEPGSGGSLPLVAALAAEYPQMALLLTGIDDPDSRVHSENESVHLDELKKCLINEALLLGYIAAESRG